MGKLMIRKLFESNRGISLVEIMVVMVVIAIGILPIAFVQSNSSRDVIKSGQRTQALTIAQNQMEQIRSLGFNAAASDSGSVDQYQWSAIVSNQGVGLNRVVVTVTWAEMGQQRTVSLDNLLSTR